MKCYTANVCKNVTLPCTSENFVESSLSFLALTEIKYNRHQFPAVFIRDLRPLPVTSEITYSKRIDAWEGIVLDDGKVYLALLANCILLQTCLL